MSFSRLGEIERGIDPHNGKRFVPSYPVVCRLARAYEVPADELLALAGHEPGPELTPEEWRLLGAFRRMPVALRAALLQAIDGDDRDEAHELGRLLTEQYAEETP